jgi:predicted ferric reductase
MNNSLYVLTIILVVFWAIAYFGYHPTSLIHILLVLAAAALALTGISKEHPIRKQYHPRKL